MDNLIKELSDLIRSNEWESSSTHIGKLQTPIKVERRDLIELYRPSGKKNEKITPKRKRREIEEGNDPDCLVVDNHREDDAETKLTICEPKKRKRRKLNSPIALEEISTEVRNFIETSCIDDQIENVASKEALSATHVKSIIKQVITDSSVLAMLRNSIYGTSEESPDFVSTFEPKLTRARARELKESGNNDSSISDAQQDVQGGSKPIDTLEVQSFITTEFPEEEDDDEYRPELDVVDEVLSDEESMLSFLETPKSSAKKSVDDDPTPKSSISPCAKQKLLHTPTSSPAMVKVRAPHQRKMIAQRTLRFNKKEEQALISNRTRSKYPMTDTPLEYLEMEFRPPDITPDMYETEVPDEEWKNFLIDFVLPPDSSKVPDDDEKVDPMYNLMADAKAEAEGTTYEELREEFRGDRAVRVSKKELSQLLAELDDVAEEGSDEGEEEGLVQGHEDGQVSKSCFVNLGQRIDQPIHQTLIPDQHEGSFVKSTYDQESTEFPDGEKIVVTILLPEFSRDQIAVLRCQLEQHVQLLTQSVVMAAYRSEYQFIEESSKGLLNDLMESGNKCGLGRLKQASLFHPFNLGPALETVNLYESRREQFRIYKENRDKKRMKTYGCSYSEKLRHKNFPPAMKKVILESAALPYPHLLRNCIFNKHGPPESKRKVLHSEYLLMASAFEPFVKDLSIFKVDLESKNGRRGTSLYHEGLNPICSAAHNTAKVFCTKYYLTFHVRKLLKENAATGDRKGNPFLNYVHTGVVSMPKAEVCPLPEKVPCKVKEFDLKILPKSFILMVDCEQKRKYYERTLDHQINKLMGKEVKSKGNKNNILIIEEEDTTKVILPSVPTSLPQSVCRKTTTKEPNTSDSAMNLNVPKPLFTYNMPFKRPVNTVAPFSVTNTISSTCSGTGSQSRAGINTCNSASCTSRPISSVDKAFTPVFQGNRPSSVYFTTSSIFSDELSDITPKTVPVSVDTDPSRVPVNYPTNSILPNTRVLPEIYLPPPTSLLPPKNTAPDIRPLPELSVMSGTNSAPAANILAHPDTKSKSDKPIPPDTGQLTEIPLTPNAKPLPETPIPSDTKSLSARTVSAVTSNDKAASRHQGIVVSSQFHCTNSCATSHSINFDHVTVRHTSFQPWPSGFMSPMKSLLSPLPPTPIHSCMDRSSAPPTPLLHMPLFGSPTRPEAPSNNVETPPINNEAPPTCLGNPPINNEAPPTNFETPPVINEAPPFHIETPPIENEISPVTHRVLSTPSDNLDCFHVTPAFEETFFYRIDASDAGKYRDQRGKKPEIELDVPQVELNVAQVGAVVSKNQRNNVLKNGKVETFRENCVGKFDVKTETPNKNENMSVNSSIMVDIDSSSSNTQWKVNECVGDDPDLQNLKERCKQDRNFEQKEVCTKVDNCEMEVKRTVRGRLESGVNKELYQQEDITEGGENEDKKIEIEEESGTEDEKDENREEESTSEDEDNEKSEESGSEDEKNNRREEESGSDEEETFEMNFFHGVKEILVERGEATMAEFLGILRDLALEEDQPENIYFKVIKLLRGHPELQKNFLMFLSAKQAQRIGKYSDYCAVLGKKELFALKVAKERRSIEENKNVSSGRREENMTYEDRESQDISKIIEVISISDDSEVISEVNETRVEDKFKLDMSKTIEILSEDSEDVYEDKLDDTSDTIKYTGESEDISETELENIETLRNEIDKKAEDKDRKGDKDEKEDKEYEDKTAKDVENKYRKPEDEVKEAEDKEDKDEIAEDKEDKDGIAEDMDGKWTKEQDLLLISSIQAEGMNAGCVLHLATRLEKTRLQVENRLEFMMKMLSQQAENMKLS